ncbi:MAG: MFS transporter [Rhodospirillales bacterium]
MAFISAKTKRNTQIISLIGSGHGMSHYYGLALPPLFPLIKAEFGVSYAALGFLVTMLNITSATVQVPMGFLVDRIGGRILLPLGLGAMAIPFLAFGFADNYWFVLVLMAIAGIGSSVFHPVDYAILNATIDEDFLGRAFSLHTLTGNIGFMLAPVSVILFASLWDWRTALVISGGIGVVIMLVMIANGRILHYDTDTKIAESSKGTNARSEPSGLRILLLPQVILMSVFFVLITMMTTGIQTFSVTTLNQTHGTPLVEATTVLTAFLVAGAFGVVFGGILADKWRRHTALAITSISLIAGLLIFIGAVPLPIIVVTVIFIATGFLQGTIRPARDMIVRSIIPDGSMGKVFGLLSTAMSVGHAITPVFLGWLIDRGMADMVFYVLAGVMLLAIPTMMAAQSPHIVRRSPAAADKAAAE